MAFWRVRCSWRVVVVRQDAFLRDVIVRAAWPGGCTFPNMRTERQRSSCNTVPHRYHPLGQRLFLPPPTKVSTSLVRDTTSPTDLFPDPMLGPAALPHYSLMNRAVESIHLSV